MKIRGVIAGLLALLGAAVAIAAGIVRAEKESPKLARTLWPNHPETLRTLAMAQIGEAAAVGKLPSAETMERVRKLATGAPFQPEPFLVHAALAQKRGELKRSVGLLLAARKRDPRSPGARYLLATHMIVNGDIVHGLEEMTVLSRLVRGAADQLVPALVEYARSPGALAKLKQLFRESPDLEPVLLSALASDARNANLALELAQPSSHVGQAGRWRSKLLRSLVDAGMYDKAYAVWARFSGITAPPTGIFRPDFTPSRAPPPFNWTFAEAGGGFAEPVPGGGLHVIHYGRKNAELASQVILLKPGRYELSTAVRGDIGSDGQLRWRVRCLPKGVMVLDLHVTGANAQKAAGQFQVPSSNCGGQWLELTGISGDINRSSDATISPLRLTRVGG